MLEPLHHLCGFCKKKVLGRVSAKLICRVGGRFPGVFGKNVVISMRFTWAVRQDQPRRLALFCRHNWVGWCRWKTLKQQSTAVHPDFEVVAWTSRLRDCSSAVLSLSCKQPSLGGSAEFDGTCFAVTYFLGAFALFDSLFCSRVRFLYCATEGFLRKVTISPEIGMKRQTLVFKLRSRAAESIFWIVA